ncbi:MAG TPA: homoserine kinase [Candidatus Methylomirabilis sp.]|nr:homoserine kinase [Candidatus Methylomirabilis sp.]
MAGQTVTVRVPASTANLGPGFDSLGLALTLYNTASLAIRQDGEVRITVEGQGRGRLDREGKGSLVARAAVAAFRYLGAEPPGLDIALQNEIPLRRGLGSSGTAILSGIAGAAALQGRTLAAEETLRLALPFEGHPDNLAPSLLGGLVASGLADGHVLAVRVPLRAPLKAVAVIPDRELPTAEARRVLPGQVPREDAVFNVTRTALLVAALATGQYACLPEASRDRLHQPYRASLLPGLEEVCEAARKAGALAAFLSGAGSTVLALVAEGGEGVGEAMRRLWRDRFGVTARICLLEVDTEGLRVA